MDEAEWRTATDELRQALGSQRPASDHFKVIDLLIPAGRAGIEVMVGFDESHLASKPTSWIYALQDEMAQRSDGENDIVGIYITAHPITGDELAIALRRTRGNDLIPLTLEQAHTIASVDGDLIEVLGPIRQLVEIATSRPEDDLVNAAEALITNIATLIDRLED